MGRKKAADPLVRQSFQIKESHLKHLKNICYDMSFKDKKSYTISYLIRETLLQAYPPPKNVQGDLFGDKK